VRSVGRRSTGTSCFRPAIAADVHPRIHEALQDIENEVIVSAESQHVSRQKKWRSSSHCRDPIGIAGIGQLVEQLASEFADFAAEDKLSPTRNRWPKSIVGSQ
jgi:hypothetical protein